MGLVGIKEEAEKIALNVKNRLMTVRHDTTDAQEACVFKPPSAVSLCPRAGSSRLGAVRGMSRRKAGHGEPAARDASF